MGVDRVVVGVVGFREGVNDSYYLMSYDGGVESRLWSVRMTMTLLSEKRLWG